MGRRFRTIIPILLITFLLVGYGRPMPASEEMSAELTEEELAEFTLYIHQNSFIMHAYQVREPAENTL